MFKLHVIQAEFGDCLLIACGSSASPRHVLIDGGPRRVYLDHLRDVLEPLGCAGKQIDLAMLSHVDIDHVAGLIDLFSELRDQDAAGEDRLIQVNELWHNSFDRAVDPNGEIGPRFQGALLSAGPQTTALMTHSDIAIQGIKEGNTLRVLALQLGVSLNSTVSGRADAEGGWPNARKSGRAAT